LDTVEGLNGVLAELAKQRLSNQIGYRDCSAVTTIVLALLKAKSKSTVASSSVAPVQPANSSIIIDDDPVEWIRLNCSGWQPFPYQAQLLRDWMIKTRVVRKSRQIGITTALAKECCFKAFTQPNRLILVISPGDRQSRVLMRKVQQETVDRNPALSSQVMKKNTSELHLANGSSIISLPNNPDRIRGFSATDIICDEAGQFLNDESVLAATTPMLAATNGSWTVVSTPRGKRGFFYDEYRLAVSEQAKRSDVKAYDFYPSSMCPLITSEFLEQQRSRLNEIQYAEEYEGQFCEQVDTYIAMSTIMGCVDQQLRLLTQGERNASYFLGLDLAKERDQSVAILLERSGDLLVVRHISAWSKMDYNEQLGRLRVLASAFKIVSGCIDQTGVGQPIVEELKTVFTHVEGVNFTQQSKTDLASGLTLLEQKKLRLPNDRKLIMQLNSLRYRRNKNGAILFESPEKPKLGDDYVWALALAIRAACRTPIKFHGHGELLHNYS
jgi:phage FluMu gp28-like protein